MKRELRPSDVRKLSKICKEIKKTLNFDNPIMENEKRQLEKQSKRFKNLLEYSVPSDEIRNKENMLKEFFGDDSQDKYEEVVYLKSEDAKEVFDILTNEGEDEALEFLKTSFHDHGTHSIVSGMSVGGMDKKFEKDGFIMIYNSNLGTIELLHKI